MSSIFYRLDELERVQREILDILHGENTEIHERDENARIATHSHEMHPKVTYSELVVDDVTNNDTLVERVMEAYQDGCISDVGSGSYNHYAGARAAILEIAAWCGENYFEGFAAKLRSQVEP